MIPGSEPVLLDLEKLFLLSDSMENQHFQQNVEKENDKAIFSNFLNGGFPSDLIAKTASPGPIVPVPTLGSCEFIEFSLKRRQKKNKSHSNINYRSKN